MKLLKRATALALAIVIFSGFFYGVEVHAAAAPINIEVVRYSSGTLDLRWNSIPGTKSVEIKYHTPDINNNAVENTVLNNQTTNTATVTGLKSDYIYDIAITLYSDENGGGEEIGKGLLYYLPKISFYCTTVEKDPDPMTGGGVQSGNKPELQLKWKEPMICTGSTFNYLTHVPDTGDIDGDGDTTELIYNTANLTMMQNALRQVYQDNRTLEKLNYQINISTHENLLNGGSGQASVVIEAGDVYKASLSGSGGNPQCVVNKPDQFGYMSFNLVGRQDSSSAAPDESPDDDKLPDGDILPGTVYYMNVKPIFMNSLGVQQNALTVGNPGDLNGSVLSGTTSYAYTPVRFQLTKDSANNIYVKIFKINQGSLDLPRLYYEVQSSDDPSIPGDWIVKRTMDDTYFSGDFAVTVISGVNPGNLYYYKIVVKSDSPDDRLESLKTPYRISVDTSRPPVPTNVTVTNRVLNQGTAMPQGSSEPVDVNSTDVTVTWSKPSGWTSTGSGLAFHFMLSTSQSDIIGDVPLYANGTYWGEWEPKYRLVKFVDGASPNIVDNGNTLSYTIKAFDLFKGENSAGDAVDIPNADGYPAFLLPNTVYYLKMYTTLSGDAGSTDQAKRSDFSIIATFTTLSGVLSDVPLPSDIKIVTNGKEDTDADPDLEPDANYLEISFNKIADLEWKNYTNNYDTNNYNYKIYYDLYMNSRTDTEFTKIGSTEETGGDVLFTGVNDETSPSIVARVSRFSKPDVVSKFGSRLLPNTPYYFTLKTRLVVTRKSDGSIDTVRESSMTTAILAVTTVVIEVTPPGENERKPLAPTDFSVASDRLGNPMVSGYSVTFTWSRRESDVIYEMIRTSARVEPNDQPSAYVNDPEYQSFLQAYDLPSDGVEDGFVYLNPDPGATPPAHPGKFSYDSLTQTCTYTVDMRIFPNKLYYFTLRAVRINSDGSTTESVWVSLPVTTSLIEAPAALEVIHDAQIGFFWRDGTAGLTADDFSIYLKGPGDSGYKAVTKTSSTIVKDRDGVTYYGRITGLKTDSYYDVKVCKGPGGSTIVYEKKGIATRNSAHEIDVKWRGLPVDDYSYFELAIMAEGSVGYTTLTTADLEIYTDKNGRMLPYYIEETAQTVNNDYQYYYARIKSSQVVSAFGTISRQALLSNCKYYIKLRAVEIDPVDMANVSYSKYIGPVDVRTEFDQGDYDDTDRKEETEAIFLDKIKELEQDWYWMLSLGAAGSKVFIKGEMAANMINHTAGSSLEIDLTETSGSSKADVVYIPLSVIKALNGGNKSLTIKTYGAEYSIKPGSIDEDNNKIIKDMKSITSVKEIYFAFTVTRPEKPGKAIPSGQKMVTGISRLDIAAQGSTKTDEQLKTLVEQKLYDKDTGLVNQKLKMLSDVYIGSGAGSYERLVQYTDTLIKMIESEIASYIDTVMESSKLYAGVKNVDLGVPMTVRMTFPVTSGLKTPYALYDGSAGWQKISNKGSESAGALVFNIIKTGEYAVFTPQASLSDVAGTHWASGYIAELSSKYDLSDVFTGANTAFSPENIVTRSEIVLLYEVVMGKTAENTGKDIRQKTISLGLDSIFGVTGLQKNLKRQEAAGVLIKILEAKKGVATGSLKAGRMVYINDEDKIPDEFYNPVAVMVDLEVMSLDGSGNFNPSGTMTRAETAAAFVKLLKITGDIAQ